MSCKAHALGYCDTFGFKSVTIVVWDQTMHKSFHSRVKLTKIKKLSTKNNPLRTWTSGKAKWKGKRAEHNKQCLNR